MTAFDTVGVTTDGYFNASPLRTPCRFIRLQARLLKSPLGFYKSGKVATSRIETGVRSGQYKYYDHVK